MTTGRPTPELARKARERFGDRPNARRLDVRDIRVILQQVKDSPHLGVTPASAEVVQQTNSHGLSSWDPRYRVAYFSGGEDW